MFRHDVVFTWMAASTAEAPQSAVPALRGWADEATRYSRVTVGVDVCLAADNGDLAVVVEPPDRETSVAYAADERRRAVVRDRVRPILASCCAVHQEL